MRHLKCVEKFATVVDGEPYVIVSVRLLENRRFVSTRLERFRADAPIRSIVNYLREEWQADVIDYQPMLFPPT